jgi:hypothetical protein
MFQRSDIMSTLYVEAAAGIQVPIPSELPAPQNESELQQSKSRTHSPPSAAHVGQGKVVSKHPSGGPGPKGPVVMSG